MSTYRHVADSAPYYDDYVGSNQEEKGYVKVLWKPSRAVQARELTQMQTYSQKQIAEMGGYLFKDGTIVHGGIISTVKKQKYFIASVTYPTGMALEDAMAGYMEFNKVGGSNNSDFDGLYDKGLPQMRFQFAGWDTYSDPLAVTTDNLVAGTTTTLVVVYYNLFGNTFADSTSASDGYVSSVNREAAMAMTFENPAASDIYLRVVRFFKDNPVDKDDIYCTCTRAFCTKGTIFVDGYFVYCPIGAVIVNPIQLESTSENEKTLSVKNISNDDEEYSIGFWINRKIVDAYEDPTLSDPASGTYNYKSSGADRYSILASLKCISSNELAALRESGELRVSSSSDTAENGSATKGIKFVTGIVMKNNVVVKEQSNVGANSEMMDVLARRTYEESGNYTVDPWKIQIEEAMSKSSEGFETEIPDKYSVNIGPGLGYIYGYRISTCTSQTILNDRSRTKMIRPLSTKYTEASLSVVSDDIYTLNDSSESPSWNTKAYYLNKIVSAARVSLLDVAIGELAKTVTEDGEWTSLTPPEITGSADTPGAYSQWAEEGLVHVLGTAAVTSISAEDSQCLRIWLLDVEGVQNLSDVSCIAAFSSSGVLEGYIDLLHQGEDNVTVWNAVEEPLIFEADWPAVCADPSTYAIYETSVDIQSDAVRTVEDLVRVTFRTDDGVRPPSNIRDVNYVVDVSTGVVIPSSKLEVKDNTTDETFEIVEKLAGTLNPTHTYRLSYMGTVGVASAADKLQGFNNVGAFKKKTLTIGMQDVSSATLTSMANSYDASDSYEDVFYLVDERNGTNASSAVKVTDLVKILAIEENSADAPESQTNKPAGTEKYWHSATDMASAITVDDGCRDFCYQQASISGLAQYYSKIRKQEGGIDSGSDVGKSIRIVFAYWKHGTEKANGFYYAGSYVAGDTVAFLSMDKLKNDEIAEEANTTGSSGESKYKRRLAEWYDIKSIKAEDTEDAYRLIPKYKSRAGSWYDLCTCFDFRPDWFGSGRLAPNAPLPSTLMSYQIATYLPRIDIVWVDKEGNFSISKGTPSDSPVPPKEKEGTMTIYTIYNQPYGKTTASAVLEYKNNQRHTMVDITAIANRLSNLEEIVSLSMSEQSAANMQITDEDGSNRYKCGIFTDNFGSFENCGLSEDGWNATIDTVENCIRPEFDLRNWGFSVLGEYVKNESGYELLYPKLMGTNWETNGTIQVYGPKRKILADGTNTGTGGTILTLSPMINTHWQEEGCPSPYSWPHVKSDAITELTNVQSMMFVVWNGNLVLTPAIDTWTNDLGEIVNETWTDSEQPPDSYRSWTTTKPGANVTKTTTKTVPSGVTVAQLDKLYGRPWTQVPKANRITHLPGWWEPAKTVTTTTTYSTVVSQKVTEKTTYTGSWQANDVSTYMEMQDEFMRVRKVRFDLEGMRPNQTFKATMDKVPLKLLTVEQFNDPNVPESSYLDEITTDQNGTKSGYFVVPENMTCGTKVVEFFDGEDTSAAKSDYTANGKTVWTNVDREYIRVWTAQTSETYGKAETTIGKKIKEKTVSEATRIFHNNDPIAESFYVDDENGITLESIQVFFGAKDPSVGAELFIVECENGYPGQTVVPFSRVFIPSSEIPVTKMSDLGTSADGTTVAYPTPTTFRFPMPLHLQGFKEYAFVVIASSYNYEIYTSTMGKADLCTGEGVREQPYVGTMYKSQNLRTWTSEPLSDIAFRMFKYKFDTTTTGVADFALDDIVSRNTGLDTTLPNWKNVEEKTEEPFNANSMTITVGTYTPASTAISLSWFSGNNPVNDARGFENRQDIFLKDDSNGTSIGFNFKEVSEENNTFKNDNSSIYVRAELSTSNENIAPQIDLEDFSGIFTRNKIDASKLETVDGVDYYESGTYFTKTIALKDPAIGLKVALDAILPNASKIKVYFKASGINASIDTVSVPGLSSSYSVTNINGDALPGTSAGDCEGVSGKRCYIWYYIEDSGSGKHKFILPHQMAYYNTKSANYSQSSCILDYATITKSAVQQDTTVAVSGDGTQQSSETTEAVYVPTKLTMKDPVNLNIVAVPSSVDVTDEGGTVAYAAETSSTGTILGVFAMPIDDEAGSGRLPSVFDPERIDSLQKEDNANYAGIMCEEYDPTTIYEDNDIVLYEGSFWKCVRGGSRNLAPANNVLNWEKVSCVLFISGKESEKVPEGRWEELQCDEYKPSTERENNFMEYNYSTTPAMELNEFDSFLIKIRMLALNTRDIPRFRNLRVVAVY